MKVRGEAHVHIRESGGTRVEKGKFRDKHDIFDGSEVYLDTELYLFGQPTGEVIVPEGDSSYPFSVPLPQNLPPSFEGEYGSVRYYLAATMDVAWQLDPENTVQFSVVSLLDLNEDQVAKVQADIKGPHLNLYADADLVIGTIPLLSSCPNANDRQAIGWTTGPQEDPRPAWHSPQPWDPTLYPNIPPPTYEAYSVGSATKGREQEDVCTFTPYYPIFSLPN
ncbi:arrestin domain-containing protein 2 [Anabrus simplex]|uniref:arrestin domain-containing protein 2 n=1 Tax=Anabrus simplex TaxID=316456 RepID=UPI0035A26678